MKNWTIQNRVLFAALVPTIAIALFLSVYFARLRMLDIENAVVAKADAIATHLAVASEYGVAAANQDILNSIAQSALSDKDFDSISISDLNNKQLAQAHRDQKELAQASSIILALRPMFASRPLNFTVSANIYTANLIPINDYENTVEALPELLGKVTLDVNLQETSARQFELLLDSLAITLLTIATAVILANWIAGTVTRPVRVLSDIVNLLSSGNLEVRAKTNAGGELARLEQGINNMASVIQASQNELEKEVQKATRDLQTTFAELEKRNEELEEARLAAVQASDFKSQFLANMSHEIRTPINAILGFSDLLSKSARDPQQKDYLTTIRKSADSLLGLLNDILDLSKVESGKLTLEKTPVNVNAILNEIYTLFAPQAANKEIEFFVELLDEKYASVRTDPLRLRQVLTNLVNNSIKFTAQGHVLLSCSCTASSNDQHTIRFCVEDTGPGIQKSAQANLFRAFSQGDMSTSRRFGGTGLGLHIANEIVFLMDGDIDFESHPGSGTVFRVTVPLTIDSNRKTRHRPFQKQPPIILLDDYPPLRPYYISILEKSGFEVIDDHLNKKMTHGLVLVNFTLNRLFKGEFKLSDKLPELPVFAFSSNYDPSAVRRLEHVGYDGVIQKSCDPRRIRYSIMNQLAKKSGHASPSLANHEPPVSSEHDDHIVLVIDDHPVNLKLAESYCNQINLNADFAESATKGIELAGRKMYNIIFMDVHMPIIDGLEATKRIRNGQGMNAKTPIVALTADAYQSTKQELIHAGAQDIIVKPMSLDVFKNAVKSWTGTGKAESPAKESLSITDKRRSLEQELRSMLIARLPQHREAIQTALAQQDHKALEYQAHRLNGASAYCDVPALTKTARQLEALIKNDSLAELAAATDQLLKEIDHLLTEKAIG